MLNSEPLFFPHYQQRDAIDCGPACLKMIARFFGKDYDIDFLRDNCYLNRDGVSLLAIGQAAEKIGFKTLSVKLGIEQLMADAPMPCILHWNQDHFIVLYKIGKPNLLHRKLRFYIADSSTSGNLCIDEETFLKSWASETGERGIALLLEPGPSFKEKKEGLKKPSKGFGLLLPYLKPYRKYLVQLFLSMLFGALISLIFPFLTQALVDYAVDRGDHSFVTIILLAQLAFFAGDIVVHAIRNWLLLHMNTRISIHLISDFLVKLMRLPIRFFDSRSMGDLTQRINDHHRIEDFLTGTSMNTLFSLVNLVLFSAILLAYNTTLFLIFFAGSLLSITWVLLFLNRRKIIDYKRFQRMMENQDAIYGIVNGMQEIKLNNGELIKRWEWERIQARLFKVQIKGLALEQYQEIGSTFMNTGKNILITYFAAQQVINGQITLGMMLSISYIIGQMNSPLQQLIGFFKSAQDARISIDRLGEVLEKPGEEDMQFKSPPFVRPSNGNGSVHHKQEGNKPGGDIILKNVFFQYEGPSSPFVLENVSIRIPYQKVTAIVGASGSGKTTLLKLLLKFYEPANGEIRLGNIPLEQISASLWRSDCGVVMQDSYVFNDTITKNIVFDINSLNEDRLLSAVHLANLREYIEGLPLKFTTKLGANGTGMSGGQRQRLLIARAVYKNPRYIFFDEATSALDANNESTILKNLNDFFKKKTVVIVAHRLSTVKNADQIIVLDKGRVVEIGSHAELTGNRAWYYELVKNQLELGT